MVEEMLPQLFTLEPSWQEALKDELQKPYIAQLAAFVEQQYRGPVPIYPPKDLIFNAFWQTPFNKVKVLIMGQDPYHGPGQSHGLCFSVPRGIPAPPSLKNIYKELESDLHIPKAGHGCLLSWAKQGVLLLNTMLTVRHKEPMSHKGHGWELFTDAVVAALEKRADPVIFVLWGRSAQNKITRNPQWGTNSRHFVLNAAHPSPLSAHNGFLGCHHFSQINKILVDQGKTPIDWSLE